MVRPLGTVKKAMAWGRKKPDIAQVTSQLRILSKELERERNRLEKAEVDTKARAVRARRDGQLDAYKTYAVEMVRFRKFALSVDQSRLHLLRILAHIIRAQSAAKTSIAVEQVAKILGMLGDARDSTKVVRNLDEITRRLEAFEIESGISDEAFDSMRDSKVTSEDLSAAMQEIDAEAGTTEAVTPAHPATEADKLEQAIKTLEKELGV
jgi:hypothetical protein